MSKIPGYVLTSATCGAIGALVAQWDGFAWGCVLGWAIAHLYFAVGESDGF